MRYPSYLFQWSGHRMVVPSCLTGLARVLDLGGVFEEDPFLEELPAQADAQALFSDWCAVGDDLARAMQTFRP